MDPTLPNGHASQSEKSKILDAAERARIQEIASFLSAAAWPPKVTLGQQPNPLPSSDAVLSALVEVGVLKLDCDRAFLSFTDNEYQHICSEVARQRLSLPENPLYLGVSKHVLSFGVCPNTMKAFTDETGQCAREDEFVIANRCCYIIKDFRTHPMFQDRPFVTGFPHMVSYLEVPLTSSTGYVIGSYCVVDNKVRQFDDQNVISTMNQLANSIMDYLNLVKSKQKYARSQRMIDGLGTFVQRIPASLSMPSSTGTPSLSGTNPRSEESTRGNSEVRRNSAFDEELTSRTRKLRESTKMVLGPSESESGRQGTLSSGSRGPWSTPPSTPFQPTDHNPMDGSTSGQGTMQSDLGSEGQTLRSDEHPDQNILSKAVNSVFRQACQIIQEHLELDGFILLDANVGNFSHVKERTENSAPSRKADLAKMLALSQRKIGKSPQTSRPGKFSSDLVRTMIECFPRGYLFSGDEHGPTHLESIATVAAVPISADQVEQLFDGIPSARHIVFLPLWHFKRECWFAAGFGWVTDKHKPINTEDVDTLYVFGSCIMTAVLQAEAQELNRSKSDFIRSLSHELRSPLHGILASSELLREAARDVANPELDMIDSCGITLLDTINNLIDFSRLDRLSEQIGSETSSSSKPEAVLTNMGELLQDVADVVFLSHASKTAFVGLPQFGTSYADKPVHTNDIGRKVGYSSVLVVLDTDSESDWNMELDVVAWKRVITNLFSNALQYTNTGTIKLTLKLVCHVPEGSELQHSIRLVVEDTGIGMSMDFQNYQMFTAFAQGNALSTGTGLGLSIVHRIVTDMEGTCTVQSRLGEGTRFDVLVPLKSRPPVANNNADRRRSNLVRPDHYKLLSGKKLRLIDLEAFQKLTGLTILHTPEMLTRQRYLNSALENFACKQLGMLSVQSEELDVWTEADIYFFDAFLLGATISADEESDLSGALLNLPNLVVLDADASSFRRNSNTLSRWHGANIVCQPLYATKLAKAFGQTLRSSQKTERPHVENARSELGKISASTLSPGHEDAGDDNKRILPDPTDTLRRKGTDDSSFTITLRNFRRADSNELLSASDADGLSPVNVLVVDDNNINLKILTAFLSKLRCSHTTAVNGLEAVQAYRSAYESRGRKSELCPFNVIFMDLSMPKMDGFEASREIRKFEQEVGLSNGAYIVALTGLGDDSSREECRQSGMDLYMRKPAKLKDLGRILEDKTQLKTEKRNESGVSAADAGS